MIERIILDGPRRDKVVLCGDQQSSRCLRWRPGRVPEREYLPRATTGRGLFKAPAHDTCARCPQIYNQVYVANTTLQCPPDSCRA
jgi:hypothetical protein